MASNSTAATAFFLLSMLTLPARSDLAWQKVCNIMADERWAPSYCLLSGGSTALIAGGYSFDRARCVASADIFTESGDRFVPLDSRLNTPRDFATATPLPDGTVLIAGGFNDVMGSLNSAEIFDPKTLRFNLIEQHMLTPRELFTATLLNDGTVLLVGGLNLWERRTQRSAEIYDPKTETFVHTTGRMADDRFGHAACILSDGRVLIVGGTSVLFGQGGFARVLASAEIYDPATGTFNPTTSNMTVARDRPTANLLPDGTVLIAGGQGTEGQSINYSEVFDPKLGTFARVLNDQITVRMAHSSVTLPNHNVLLAGGWSASAKATTSSVEEFDPSIQSFTAEPPLPFSSHDAALVVFEDGGVLAAGGKSVTSDGSADGIACGAFAKP